jgi:RimJ/RimL family protein N-acetyltransferase
VTQSQEWIEGQISRYSTKKYGHHALILKKTSKLIGQCGLLIQEVENTTEMELGYHILPEYWGNGFATEAAKRFRDYAFENSLCESLISVIDVRNITSQNVAEKNGFKRTKRIKHLGLDVFIYRMYKKEWYKDDWMKIVDNIELNI